MELCTLYGVFGAIICYRAVYSPPTGPIRIRGRLVAPRACEMALMVKHARMVYRATQKDLPWSDVRVDAFTFRDRIIKISDSSD